LPGGKTYDKDWERGVERLLSEPPQMKLDLNLTTTIEYQERAEQIKKEWEEFGIFAAQRCQEDKAITDKSECERMQISVTIRVQSIPDTTNFQLLLIGYGIDPDPDQYAMWHSDQPTNITGYKNTRIDNLLEKARQSTDQSDRKQQYQEFQQFLLEDPPAIFLEYIKRYEVKRNQLLTS
jgi:ABC-type transport system substrate-binding protein